MIENFYLPPVVESLSGIPSGRKALYEATVKQVEENKKSVKIKYGMSFDTINLE